MEKKKSGRPKLEGKACRWIVPHDIYKYAKERGIAYVWDAVRFKVAFDNKEV